MSSTNTVNFIEYLAFFELSTELFAIVDLQGRFAKVNHSWTQVLGYQSSELLSRAFLDFVHPDDVRITIEQSERCNSGEAVMKFQNRYRAKDGSYRWLAWTSTTDLSTGLIYAAARDITMEKEAHFLLLEASRKTQDALELERSARELSENQRKRLQELFTQVPAIAAFLTGPDHVFEIANPEYRKLVGGRDVVGKSVRDAIPSLDEKTLGLLDRVFTSGERFVAQNHRVSADWRATGIVEERVFTFIYEPFREPNGDVGGIWVLAYDMTEQTNLEAQLRTAERMASLGQMAAGIAHEINNPLGYSMLSLDLLQGGIAKVFGPDDARTTELTELVANSVRGLERVRDIVKGLKAFSRYDDRKLAPIDLREAIRTAVDMTAHEVRHSARLALELSSVPVVDANTGQLTQVFVNILLNATHAIQEAGAKGDTIVVKSYTGGNGAAVVEITDKGCGIPEENLSRIFEPFFTSKPVGKGTGLGLSVCHGIVAGFGGSIQVSSQVGEGTRVKVVLPPSEQARPSTESTERAQGLKAEDHRGRILVVDDDADLRSVVADILSGKNDVVEAGDALGALERVFADPEGFDLILCDLMMPEVSGKDFYDLVGKFRPGLEERIVFVTGGAFTPALRNWVMQVPKRVLYKPFDAKELRRIVSDTRADRIERAG